MTAFVRIGDVGKNHYVPLSSHNYPGIITMTAFVRTGDLRKTSFTSLTGTKFLLKP